ncbi:hypothetical protein L218DRAFT_1004728 [Marasmius fiardii PR-910]|nr:hypothetical protein L218DRAFT_1004728 [Marasmius fiardii PR-910]
MLNPRLSEISTPPPSEPSGVNLPASIRRKERTVAIQPPPDPNLPPPLNDQNDHCVVSDYGKEIERQWANFKIIHDPSTPDREQNGTITHETSMPSVIAQPSSWIDQIETPKISPPSNDSRVLTEEEVLELVQRVERAIEQAMVRDLSTQFGEIRLEF